MQQAYPPSYITVATLMATYKKCTGEKKYWGAKNIFGGIKKKGREQKNNILGPTRAQPTKRLYVQ